MPCHRIDKFGMHAHHHDCSAAVTIFANRTFFWMTLIKCDEIDFVERI
jgi:hypothetical protein